MPFALQGVILLFVPVLMEHVVMHFLIAIQLIVKRHIMQDLIGIAPIKSNGIFM